MMVLCIPLTLQEDEEESAEADTGDKRISDSGCDPYELPARKYEKEEGTSNLEIDSGNVSQNQRKAEENKYMNINLP